MTEFSIIDRISDPGDARKANDDCVGVGEGIAVVADGATGLSNERLVKDAESDAQWVAKLICESLAAAGADEPVRDLVADVCKEVRAAVFRDEDKHVPRYAWPVSGFIAARKQGAMLEITGLGDCVAYLRFSDGFIQSVTPIAASREHEVALAANALKQKTSKGPALEDGTILDGLRKERSQQNTEASNVWTVSAVPEAAEHVMSMAIPLENLDSVLLASDGFSAAVEDYKLYDEAGLFAQIEESGMAAVVEQIRHTERVTDPDQTKFPRFKQSDDATAILVKIIN